MRQQKPKRSPSSSRRKMRLAFEKYEQSLYPDDKDRLTRCDTTGEYVDTLVQIGFVDWKKAWDTAWDTATKRTRKI